MPTLKSHITQLTDGINISYTDNGAPPGSQDYTTVIVLHGMGFNGHNMEKLHEYSHRFNLRTLVWNRREYSGSSKYTDLELDDLANGRKKFLDRLGLHLAQFMTNFLKENPMLPKISYNGVSGGFAVLGWSIGCTTALSLFSDRSIMSSDLYEMLSGFVKTLVLYDPPSAALAHALPPDANLSILYDPMSHREHKAPEELLSTFNAYVSSYYDHPTNPASINDLHCFVPRTEQCTMDNWSEETIRRCCEHGAALRSDIDMLNDSMQRTIRTMCARALIEDVSQAAFPNASVVFICPTRTTWRCLWAGIQAEQEYKEALRQGKRPRSAIFVPLEGCNHFAHWDAPEKLLEAVAHGIQKPAAKNL